MLLICQQVITKESINIINIFKYCYMVKIKLHNLKQ